MPVRAVLFDLFDTLVDLRLEDLPEIELDGRTYRSTYRRLYEAIVQRIRLDFETFARALAEVDREVRDAYYGKGRELPTRDRFEALVERLGVDAPDLPDLLTEVHMGTLREQAVFLEHHPGVLERLRGRARLGLVSNFSHSPTARALLEEAGLLGHFDAIVISDRVGFRKPRPEIFRAALAELGVAAEETLHVGDSLVADVRGAAALGIRPVWLTRRVPDPERALDAYSGSAPHRIVEDLDELPDLLAGGDRGA
jgi:HAD superfamily hydrolase (TIGR01549 family)